MKRIGCLGFGLLALTTAVEAAPTAPPSGACFEVVANGPDALPNGPILVNRCTGATWLLVRTPLADQKGAATGSFTYVWEPLSVGRESPDLSLGLPPVTGPGSLINPH
jgi:hypothetical protein